MKLIRILAVIALGVIIFCCIYSILPLIAYLFGLGFITVSRHVGYIFFGSIVSLATTVHIIMITFDQDFYLRD